MLNAINEDVNAGVTTQAEADEARKQEHAKHHLVLHMALDELITDFIQHTGTKSLSKTSILTLMEWSYEQTKDPTP